MKKAFLLTKAMIFLFAVLTPCMAQMNVWHQNISTTGLNVRGNPVVVGEVTADISEPGYVLVRFDGNCVSSPGDVIVLAASNGPDWTVNDGYTCVEAVNINHNAHPFSQSRVYQVSPGSHTFYAVAQNYWEEDGDGRANIYATLIVKFFPAVLGAPFVQQQGIARTEVLVRGGTVKLGEISGYAPQSGKVLVHFDGLCYSSPGDRIVLAASDTINWLPNDGNVTVESVDDDINSNCFSHTRVYSVGEGNFTFYAVAENVIEVQGTGYCSVYGSLTVEYYPDQGADFVQEQGIAQTDVAVRTWPVNFAAEKVAVPSPGKIVLHFDGLCLSSVGDRIVLAASNIPDWQVNDGNVSVEAVSEDLNRNCFSHTRVYEVQPGEYNYYAVVQNFVETYGTGLASVYGCFTVEFISEVTPDMVAYYQLDQDSIDMTGHNDPMYLTNTPFQEGGIYCNGIYLNSGLPDFCNAITPNLSGLDFESFSIRADFKVTDYPENIRPVFVGGNAYRWLGFYLDADGTVTLKYNNSTYLKSSIVYTLDTWHEALVTYDGASDSGKLYLDHELACAAHFVLVHENDSNIGITDFSNGKVFKGVFKNLIVFNGVKIPNRIENPESGIVDEYVLKQNYPNPFNNSTVIGFSLPRAGRVSLVLFDITGRKVAILLEEKLSAGEYQVPWQAQNLSSGVYIYRLATDGFMQARKLVVVK